MKQFERIQKEIQGMDSGMAMTGFLNGIETTALIWCKKNDPDDIYVIESGETKVSICGMAAYLDSEVE